MLSLHLKDEHGQPLAGQRFKVFQDGNTIASGLFDKQGLATIKSVTADRPCEVEIEDFGIALGGHGMENDSLPINSAAEPDQEPDMESYPEETDTDTGGC